MTLGIAAYILWHAGSELPPVIRLLMLAAPAEPETEQVRAVLGRIAGVEGVHHVHLWEIDERRRSVEAHLVVANPADGPEICRAAKAAPQETFDIAHSTLEVETPRTGCA